MRNRTENKCIKCGDCCQFQSFIRLSPEQMRTSKNEWAGHWELREKPKEKPRGAPADWKSEDYYWYKCDMFDIKTKQCKDYDRRPEMCRQHFCGGV